MILFSCNGSEKPSSSQPETTGTSETSATTDLSTEEPSSNEESSMEGPANSEAFSETFIVEPNQNIESGSNGEVPASISDIEIPSHYGTYVIDKGRSNCLNNDDQEEFIEEILQVVIRNDSENLDLIQAFILVEDGESSIEFSYTGSSQGNTFTFPRQNSGEDSDDFDSSLTGEISENGEVNMDMTIYADKDIKCKLVLRKKNPIQERLDGGETPLQIVKSGVDVKELYGKKYSGGLIFYLNTDDGTGMVAATQNQSDGAEWGCTKIDIKGLDNVRWYGRVPEGSGSEIGDGSDNTDKIIGAKCMSSDGSDIAAKLCRDKGEEWFLPSIKELDLMYTNLHSKGHGGFAADWYWSSTEVDDYNPWVQNFLNGGQSPNNKYNDNAVRAVRAF